MKTRFKSYNFWIRIVSVLLLLARIIGNEFGYEIDSLLFMDIATAVAGVLVVLGVISAPVSVGAASTIEINSTASDNKTNNNQSKKGEIMDNEQKQNFSQLREVSKDIYADTEKKLTEVLTSVGGVTTIAPTVRKIIGIMTDDGALADVEKKEGVVDTESILVDERENAELIEDYLVKCDKDIESIENSTESIENSTEIVENSTEIVENSTEIVENSTEILEKRTEAVENSTASIENSTEIVENFQNEQEVYIQLKDKIKALISNNLDSIIDEIIN